MDVSQCYAGSGLLYFSLHLNSRKSLFGPLVNLGMPKETHFPAPCTGTVSFPVSFLPSLLLPCIPLSLLLGEFSVSKLE